MWREWDKNWRSDFAINGGLLPERFDKKFVMSKKNACEPQPSFIIYYNDLIDDTYNYIIETYDKSKDVKDNYNFYFGELVKLRKSNFDKLKKLLQKKDKNHQFFISDLTNYNDSSCFGRYAIYSLKDSEIRILLKATYENAIDYINELFPDYLEGKEF
ncbi:MAG: hypothetical protein LUG99_22745 [Lachnospiraceae bacterium]|nr:hypothetical protein [Lachnospiraceae bacterium]